MSCAGYSGCNMCNRCGKFTELLSNKGKRLCPACRYAPTDDEKICPECGLVLPPVIKAPPGVPDK